VVSAAIETARTWPRIEAVILTVSENAPAARALYESLGFIPWGFEPDALRVDGRSYAETHMRLPI
jgi:RimJ/RimL family protein N-acetyltransferase